jgi:hypothetical protein
MSKNILKEINDYNFHYIDNLNKINNSVDRVEQLLLDKISECIDRINASEGELRENVEIYRQIKLNLEN